jgi:hypothetical protein
MRCSFITLYYKSIIVLHYIEASFSCVFTRLALTPKITLLSFSGLEGGEIGLACGG